MDSYGPCDTTRPNMGKYQCFLGSEQFQEDSFFQSAEFLYYYLIVAIIIVTNLIFFSITGFSLCKHWYQMKNIQSRYYSNIRLECVCYIHNNISHITLKSIFSSFQYFEMERQAIKVYYLKSDNSITDIRLISEIFEVYFACCHPTHISVQEMERQNSFGLYWNYP